MKIVRDSAVRQEPAQPQAVSPEENRFSIRPRQIALFFLWMLAFTLLARGTSGALLPEVQLSTPAPNTITQSLTATGTIQWAAGSLFYLPEGLLVEAVFVSEGEAVQEGDKIAALRREDVEQKLRSLQAELAQKQTEYARLTKPVAADSYDLEKAQQALQAAYQAAENSAAAWEEKEANAGSERDALQRELNERQEKAAQYAREIAEKQAQRKLLQQEESPDMEVLINTLKEMVSFIKDWGALIIAGISLLVAIISLFKSSKAQRLQNKVNELELKIKQDELDKITKEKEDAELACVEARFITVGKGKHRLKVWNSGNATAYHVSARFDGDVGIMIMGQEKQPFEELEARKSYELVLITHNGSASKFRIVTEWTDSSGNQHTKTQMGDFS